MDICITINNFHRPLDGNGVHDERVMACIATIPNIRSIRLVSTAQVS